MQEWLTRSAAKQAEAIRTLKIDPVALTEAYLDAIRAHPAGDRIYARLTPDRALAEAAAARDRAKNGLSASPLDGVPISWKDLFDTSGAATEAGSALLKGRTPSMDARVLRNATALGTVCLGKTHMSELAFSGLGLNPMTETPPNINFPTGAPGGSSSGAAASVAFGLAALAIGSDTGGSVRVPSAWNDLAGLKTTAGRISLDGVVPLCRAFDTVGPLARNVEDLAMSFAMLEGRRAPDLRGASVSGRRFAVLDTIAMDDLRDAPGNAFDGAVSKLQSAGAQISRLVVPELAEAMGLSNALFNAEAYGIWGDAIEAAPEKMYPPIRDRFRIGRDIAGDVYVRAWERLNEIRAIWAEAAAEYDAVICPTSPILPPDAQRLLTDEAYYTSENLLALRNTRIGNLMGLCALSLPTGEPSCGLMVMGAPGKEASLLRLGQAAETALL